MSGARRTPATRTPTGAGRTIAPSAAPTPAPTTTQPAGPWDPPVDPFEVLDSKTFARSKFRPTWLVEDWLAAGQLAVIGGAPKSLKTFFCVALAVSLASGRPLLGLFKVPNKRRVLFFSGESGAEKLKRTADQLCETQGVQLDQCEIFWHTEPPDLTDADGWRKLHWTVRGCTADVVVIDPAYLSLFGRGGASPANVFDAGRAIMQVHKSCQDAGATLILVYHTRKRKAAKARPVGLSDLAFAGIAEAARQWVLIDHRKPYIAGTGLHRLRFSVGGSAGHSGRYFIDVDEGAGKQAGQSLRVRVLSEVEAATEEADTGSDGRPGKRQVGLEYWVSIVADWFDDHPEGDTKTGVRKATGCPQELIDSVLKAHLASGLIETTKIPKQSGPGIHDRDGYRLKAERFDGQAEIDPLVTVVESSPLQPVDEPSQSQPTSDLSRSELTAAVRSPATTPSASPAGDTAHTALLPSKRRYRIGAFLGRLRAAFRSDDEELPDDQSPDHQSSLAPPAAPPSPTPTRRRPPRKGPSARGQDDVDQ